MIKTPSEFAIALLGPMVADVTDWIAGKGEARPKVMALLPNELQSEAALMRLEARRAAGHEPREAVQPSVELPQQTSSLKVSTQPE